MNEDRIIVIRNCCVVCGEELPPHTIATRKYCSDFCLRSQRAQERREERRSRKRQCIACGKPRPPGTSKYCSRVCRNDQYNKRKREQRASRAAMETSIL